MIDYSKNIPEKVILANQHSINWYKISYSQKLSQKILLRFKHNFNWMLISEYQDLSEKFIFKHHKLINFTYLLRNKRLRKYSKKCQNFIVYEIIKDIRETKHYYKYYMTDYMYEKYCGFLLFE